MDIIIPVVEKLIMRFFFLGGGVLKLIMFSHFV